jgi:Flp pilus assembly protein TadD
MSDEWYVRFGGLIQGPTTASEIREALTAGIIQPETPVRAGTNGAWTPIREFPELGAVPQTASLETALLGGKDSVVLDSANLRRSEASQGLYGRLILGGAIAVAAFGGGVFAVIQLNRPSETRRSHPTAIDSAATPRRSEKNETIKVAPPVSPPKIAPVVKVADAAKVETVPEAPLGNSIEPAEKSVRSASVAPQNPPSEGGSSPVHQSPSRDSFDIPWPSGQGDAAIDQLDWEKLNNIISEHNKLFEQWKRQRQRYQELNLHLKQVSDKLENFQRRADAIQHTMNKIHGVLGDQNTENAPVFAPPETPRYVQSLAKNYTLRMRDMSWLDAQATPVVSDFNETLKNIDTNLSNQRTTLTHATELRSEWARIARPFGLWVRQDRPIPVESSTRWILDNPVFAAPCLARCIAEIREKSFVKAEEDIELAIKRDPSWAELYAIQAVLQDHAGQHPASEQSFKKARRLAKKSTFVDVCEGIIYSKHKNYGAARSKFRSAAKHDASDPAAHAELALLLVAHPDPKMHDATSAVEAATAACKATAWSHWWCLDVLAISYAASGDFDRAVGCVRRAKQAGPPDVQQLLDERIASYQKKQVPTVAVGEL